MWLLGLIVGIAIWLPAMASWSQSPPPKRVNDKGWSAGARYDRAKPTTGWYDTGSGYSYDYSYPIDYSQEITKSLERLHSEPERLATKEILDELDKKTNREIFDLKLAPDVCQEIPCRAVSPDVVRRYVAAYADMRVADDANQTALRSAAAAERSTLIAAASASVSLLSLLVSVLSYRRSVRSAKSAIPA